MYVIIDFCICCGCTRKVDVEPSGRQNEVAILETVENIHGVMMAEQCFDMWKEECGSNRHVLWFSGFFFEGSLGYEKAIPKMVAVFAYNRSKMCITNVTTNV